MFAVYLQDQGEKRSASTFSCKALIIIITAIFP